MNDADFERKWRAIRPTQPTERLWKGLEATLSYSPPEPAVSRRGLRWLPWLLERLAWSGAGAVAAWLLLMRPGVLPTQTYSQVSQEAPAIGSVRVSEELLAFSDEGVHFLANGANPARLWRRLSMEHHVSADGVETQVPREDVIVLPVQMQ